MPKLIDFHAHIYPDAIARRAVEGIERFYGVSLCVGNGTTAELVALLEHYRVSAVVCHAVATTPHQVGHINDFIAGEARRHPALIPFMTLHPALSVAEIKAEYRRARDEMQCALLKKIGADEIIYADGEVADKLAIRHNGNNIFDYIPLAGGYAIFEVPIVKEWKGRTISEIDVRKKYKINIIAIKNGNSINPTPMPDYCFKEDDHIFVLGQSRDVFKLSVRT